MARGIRSFIAKALWAPELAALMAEHNKLVEEVEELKTKLGNHVHVESAAALGELNKAIGEIAEIKTNLGSHTHGGVTTGSDTSSATAEITYVAPAATAVTPTNVKTAVADTITYANAEASKVA